MKIGFVIGNLPIVPVYDWGSIRKFNRQGLPGFTLNDYWKIRGLEINTQFNEEITRTRFKIGISKDGLSYEEFIKINPPYPYGEETKFFNEKVDKEVERILREFNVDSMVAKHIRSILLANVVLPYYENMSDRGEISIQTEFDENDINFGGLQEPSVYIRVTSATKPESIIEFIRDNRKKLRDLLKKLPQKIDYSLSREKIELVLERREKSKLTNKNFFTKYAVETENNNLPRSIEKLYNDTEKTIKLLFYKK